MSELRIKPDHYAAVMFEVVDESLCVEIEDDWGCDLATTYIPFSEVEKIVEFITEAIKKEGA